MLGEAISLQLGSYGKAPSTGFFFNPFTFLYQFLSHSRNLYHNFCFCHNVFFPFVTLSADIHLYYSREQRFKRVNDLGYDFVQSFRTYYGSQHRPGMMPKQSISSCIRQQTLSLFRKKFLRILYLFVLFSLDTKLSHQ